MERWQVKPLDLVDIVLYENLSIFEPDGRLAEYKFEESLRANHPEIFPLPPLPKKDNPSMYELILNPEPYDFEIPGSTLTDPNYIPLANRIEQLMFKLIQVELFEKEHNFSLQNNQVKLKKERIRSFRFAGKKSETRQSRFGAGTQQLLLKIWP